MSEAPELKVVRSFLERRIVGVQVQAARVIKPSVLRSLCGELPTDIASRAIEGIQRRGKFLLIHLSGGRGAAINPMLTGAIQYCSPQERLPKRTCRVLSLSNAREMRYLSERQMGMVYYGADDLDSVPRLNEHGSDDLDSVPRLNEHGSDVLDDVSFNQFTQRLRGFHREIKEILTRGRVVAGMGNAYAGKILFAAMVNPLKVRGFLQVHTKGGLPCPRCGATISEITAHRRITSYCRKCQPGMLVKN